MPMLIVPKEIREKEKRVEPYMIGCHLRDDTPDEIRQLDKEVLDWYHEQSDGFM